MASEEDDAPLALVAPEGTQQRWVFEAPYSYLRDAARFARIHPSAVRQTLPNARASVQSDAELVWPSVFCAEPKRWLTALAHVVLRNVPVRLYLVETEAADEERVIAFTRLYPQFDAETLSILRAFSTPQANAVDDAGARVANAFARLRAEGVIPDLTGDDPGLDSVPGEDDERD